MYSNKMEEHVMFDSLKQEEKTPSLDIYERLQLVAFEAPNDYVLSSTNLLSKAQAMMGKDRIASVSSFGAESAVLLHLISRFDKDFPIFFLDTGKHFTETLEYVELLTNRLRLTNVQFVSPNIQEIHNLDVAGNLWSKDPDQCCAIRKVNPLTEILENFDGWITGRKRFHGGGRFDLPLIEQGNDKIKINPLVEWTAENIKDHFQNFGLPSHPLIEEGYSSIGCETCTKKPALGSDVRSGRWAGQAKFECGIHRAA